MTINRAMGNTYPDLKQRQVISQGWPHLGNLTNILSEFFPPSEEARLAFETRIVQLSRAPYPEDAEHPPQAMLNLYNLLSITKGDLVVAVHSAHGAGPVMGICQAEKNAWESYHHDDPNIYDYANTVCSPVHWVDWQEINAEPPRPPTMIAGVIPMGKMQGARVIEGWQSYLTKQG
jgi:hypothetical protein